MISKQKIVSQNIQNSKKLTQNSQKIENLTENLHKNQNFDIKNIKNTENLQLNEFLDLKIIQNTENLIKNQLYFGIDVWGRNTFGGGQFNSYKAFEITLPLNVSTAIFAPGWLYETQMND